MHHSSVFWGLNGCRIIFWRNFRTQYKYLCFNMPLESLQTDFSNRLMQFFKKIHTFFLILRSLMLKLMYLCNLRSPRFYLQYFSSPLNLLSNAIGLTWFGFFKAKLCPISHNGLIMDCFSRVNLYGLPHVTLLFRL